MERIRKYNTGDVSLSRFGVKTFFSKPQKSIFLIEADAIKSLDGRLSMRIQNVTMQENIVRWRIEIYNETETNINFKLSTRKAIMTDDRGDIYRVPVDIDRSFTLTAKSGIMIFPAFVFEERIPCKLVLDVRDMITDISDRYKNRTIFFESIIAICEQTDDNQGAPDRPTENFIKHRVRKNLELHFSLEDLHNICYDLSFDSESISNINNSKSTFIRNLLIEFERQGRIEELIEEFKKKRPHINWY